MKEQFIIILPSNSSMRYYPENTTTSFITQLPRQVTLFGQWEVALTEIQFPHSFLHIRSGDEARLLFLSSEDRKNLINFGSIHITTGVYRDLTDLTRALNKASEFIGAHLSWRLESSSGGKVFLERTCKKEECSLSHHVKMSTKLSRILGFDIHKKRDSLVHMGKARTDDAQLYCTSDSIPDIGEFSSEFYTITPTARVRALESDEPASAARGIPDKLFVYCDICESYITGDVHSPLLRVVPIEYTSGNYSYGCNIAKHFSSPNYIPLRLTRFRTIEIDIRDQLGERIPFEFGTLTVTLQFRRSD